MVSGKPNLVSAPGSESKSKSLSKSLREAQEEFLGGGWQTKFNVSSRLRVKVKVTE